MLELGVAPTLILPVVLSDAHTGVATLTLAAVKAVHADDPVLLATPSHLPDPVPAAALARAAGLAVQGFVVAFGRPLDAASDGEGCIRADGRIGREAPEAHYIEALEEQPDSAAASAWLRNAGIYAVRASVWIDAIGSLRRDILAACERAASCPAGTIRSALRELVAGSAISPAAVVVRI